MKTVMQTSVGMIEVEVTERGVCRVEFVKNGKGDRYVFPRKNVPVPITALAEYFAGKRTDFSDIPLDLHGTAFQKKVWKAMQQIPAGTTMTYGALGKAIRCASAQAVGQACKRNPVAIIVPCHRVVPTVPPPQGRGLGGGVSRKMQGEGRRSIGGYNAGVWRKRWLLEHERNVAQRGSTELTMTQSTVRPSSKSTTRGQRSR